MKSSIIIAATLAASISSSAFANSIIVDSKVPYAEDADVRSAVREECELEQKFARFIQEYAKDKGFTVVKSTDKEKAKGVSKRLFVEIDEVRGGGGGAWSGGKMVHAVGKLTENGKVIGTFKVQRTSGGGAFGAFKGTCSILGRDVKAMGKDIAKWLKKPKMKSYLGEL